LLSGENLHRNQTIDGRNKSIQAAVRHLAFAQSKDIWVICGGYSLDMEKALYLAGKYEEATTTL
jgi:hypothetical protein